MTAEILLGLYCLLLVAFSLLGGQLPTWVNMTHTRTQLAMSFVSGLMLGVAFYHLLPHSVAIAGPEHGLEQAVWWLMVGLVTMLLLLRMFHFHQHEFSPAESPHHHHHGEPDVHTHQLSWMGIGLGLGLHTFVDGIALGASVKGDPHAGEGLAGLGVFLAIALHKPLDAMSITSLMGAAGKSNKSRLWVIDATR